jgi:hypothetical protein
MEPISIALTCGSVLKTVAGVTKFLTQTIKDFRTARSELTAVRGEINSLQAIVELIEHDCNGEAYDEKTGSENPGADDVGESAFPEALVLHLGNILGNCSDVLKDLNKLLAKHFSTRFGPSSTWVISGKEDVSKLKATLAAHTAALNLALNLVEVYAFSLSLRKKI